MRKLLLLLFVSVFLLQLTVADDTQQFRQNRDATLLFLCEDNGNPCSSTTTCNITIYYPDDSLFIDKATTINRGEGEFTYNLTTNQTTTLGTYNTIVTCNDFTIDSNPLSFYYEVVPGDAKGNLWFLIIFLAGAWIVTLVGAKIESVAMAGLGGLFMVMIGLFTLLNGIDVYRNTITEMFSIITMCLGGFFAVLAGYRLIER